jgi:hypothetical protein
MSKFVVSSGYAGFDSDDEDNVEDSADEVV